MKPARSCTSTGVLPHAWANAVASAMVSSLAVSGRTISTRLIAGAGLKKWTPHTRSGRSVTTASSTTGSVEVLVARMASVRHDVVELGEEVLLDVEVLDHRLEHQVAVGEGVQVVGGADPGRPPWRPRPRRACPSRPAWPGTSPGPRPWRRPSPACGTAARPRCRPWPPPRRCPLP